MTAKKYRIAPFRPFTNFRLQGGDSPPFGKPPEKYLLKKKRTYVHM